jgi:hypothetical protein
MSVDTKKSDDLQKLMTLFEVGIEDEADDEIIGMSLDELRASFSELGQDLPAMAEAARSLSGAKEQVVRGESLLQLVVPNPEVTAAVEIEQFSPSQITLQDKGLAHRNAAPDGLKLAASDGAKSDRDRQDGETFEVIQKFANLDVDAGKIIFLHDRLTETVLDLLERFRALGVSLVTFKLPGQAVGQAKTHSVKRTISASGQECSLAWVQAGCAYSLSIVSRDPFSVQLTIVGGPGLTPRALKWARPSSVADDMNGHDHILLDLFPVQVAELGRLEVAIGKGAYYGRLEAIEAASRRSEPNRVVLLLPELVTE